jgi:biotin synthase
MESKIGEIAGRCLDGCQIDRQQIQQVLEADYYDRLYWANRIRERFFGNEIKICSIVPGRIGGCDQDCKFCAQSARYDTSIDVKVLSDDEILAAARQARENGVKTFGIVYSGKAISEKELGRLETLLPRINQLGLQVCGSVGIIDQEQANRFAAAGMARYNHNLETSEKHFQNIVTTHNYSDRIKTIKIAQKAGMGVCAGGIFGIGEDAADRIEMALLLRELGVDCITMNFLHPIKGTPLAKYETLKPREILGIIALYRFILTDATLKVAGGRVLNLGDSQSWIFYAGANAILSGNYLTTAGRAVAEDAKMITDLGLEAQLD